HPDPGLRNQPPGATDGRGPGRRSRALPEGLSDPLRRGDRAWRRLRRGRQRLPRNAGLESGRGLRGVSRRGRGTLLLHRGRGVSRHPARRRDPVLSSRVVSVARAGATAVKAALAYLDEAELIDLTRALIRIPSVVRPGDAGATEAAVAGHVQTWLTKRGLDVEVQDVAP